MVVNACQRRAFTSRQPERRIVIGRLEIPPTSERCPNTQHSAKCRTPSAMSKTVHITSAEHFESILSSSKAVIADCELFANADENAVGLVF